MIRTAAAVDMKSTDGSYPGSINLLHTTCILLWFGDSVKINKSLLTSQSADLFTFSSYRSNVNKSQIVEHDF